MKRLVVILLAVLVTAVPASAQHTMEVSVVINNTDNNVYVPGIGESPSSVLGGFEDYVPEHFYIASYLNDLVTGLAAKEGLKLFYGRSQGRHFLGLQQNLDGPGVFVAMTKGDWHVLERRMDIIETGKFLTEVSPAFGFSMYGMYYPLTIMLKYSEIKLLGERYLGTGQARISIENVGVSDGKTAVEIKKS